MSEVTEILEEIEPILKRRVFGNNPSTLLLERIKALLQSHAVIEGKYAECCLSTLHGVCSVDHLQARKSGKTIRRQSFTELQLELTRLSAKEEI